MGLKGFYVGFASTIGMTSAFVCREGEGKRNPSPYNFFSTSFQNPPDSLYYGRLAFAERFVELPSFSSGTERFKHISTTLFLDHYRLILDTNIHSKHTHTKRTPLPPFFFPLCSLLVSDFPYYPIRNGPLISKRGDQQRTQNTPPTNNARASS